jgi:dihydrofolate reductase
MDEVRKLKEQPGKDIYVDGSSVLVHSLAQAGLVDEYNLLVFPIVLGTGKKVFPEGFYTGLKLVESKSFPSGVILMRYQPERK